MSQNVQQDMLNKIINSNLKNITNNTNASTNDIKQQNAIDNALVKSGLPQNKLNALITMAQDHLLCDSACQKQRASGKLKQIWDDSETNLKTAPSQVEIAEKNYYIYDKGYPKYQDMLFDRYSKTAKDMKTSSIEKHKELVNELETQIKNYDDAYIYYKRMYDLLDLKFEENKLLKSKIDNYIGKVPTRVTPMIMQLQVQDSL
jgi:hypothetical protein